MGSLPSAIAIFIFLDVLAFAHVHAHVRWNAGSLDWLPGDGPLPVFGQDVVQPFGDQCLLTDTGLTSDGAQLLERGLILPSRYGLAILAAGRNVRSWRCPLLTTATVASSLSLKQRDRVPQAPKVKLVRRQTTMCAPGSPPGRWRQASTVGGIRACGPFVYVPGCIPASATVAFEFGWTRGATDASAACALGSALRSPAAWTEIAQSVARRRVDGHGTCTHGCVRQSG